MGAIYFEGLDLSYFNVSTDESEIFVTPEKDYEFVDVPGLNGRLTLDNHRLKDITLPINCFVRGNFEENYHNLMNFLLSRSGYAKLELSQDPDHFRRALFYNAVRPDTGSFNKSGKFTLNFNCRPERYLTSGSEYAAPIEITQNEQTISNPTFFTSKPRITLFGNGWFKFEMGSIPMGTYKSYTIDVTGREPSGPGASVILDCETMMCYDGADGSNAGEYVVLYNGFPEFEPTIITCTYSTDASSGTKMSIIPRWWEV